MNLRPFELFQQFQLDGRLFMPANRQQVGSIDDWQRQTAFTEKVGNVFTVTNSSMITPARGDYDRVLSQTPPTNSYMSVLEKVCRVKHDYSQQLVIPMERSVSGRYRCKIFKDFTGYKKGNFEVRWISFSPDDLVILSEVEMEVVMKS